VNTRPKNEGSMIFHKQYGFNQVGTQTTENGKKEVSLMEYIIPSI
jgi:predicted GNAT superfamily acetyltransferase